MNDVTISIRIVHAAKQSTLVITVMTLVSIQLRLLATNASDHRRCNREELIFFFKFQCELFFNFEPYGANGFSPKNILLKMKNIRRQWHHLNSFDTIHFASETTLNLMILER